jgi:ribosomal protein S18 acetylase RimI-like enzyme
MTDTRIPVRALGGHEVDSIARAHRQAFPSSALSSLGDEAVRRYYEWQLTGPHDAVALGTFDAGELVGFCVAGVFRGALSGYLRANATYIVRSLATHPKLLASAVVRGRLRHGVRGVVRAGRRRPTSGTTPPAFGILVVGVVPDHRRRGVGGALIRAAEEVAIQRGFDTMRLTVAVDNEPAISFYEAAGWTRTPPVGQWSGAMERPLHSTSR